MVESFLVSQALLWIAVIALASLNILLLRQVGVLFERVAPAGALATNAVLSKGDLVERTKYPTLGGAFAEIGGVSDTGKDTLVMFVAPNCPVCKSLLPAVLSMSKAEASTLTLTFASAGGEEKEHARFVRSHQLGAFSHFLSDALGVSFGVGKLPYAVLISADGTIASFGLVNTREHLESLLEARSRGVVSIQEYIHRDLKTSNMEGA